MCYQFSLGITYLIKLCHYHTQKALLGVIRLETTLQEPVYKSCLQIDGLCRTQLPLFKLVHYRRVNGQNFTLHYKKVC